jgi:murein DD-endopeptidase MepM/ murein hydrolase activator NlpD
VKIICDGEQLPYLEDVPAGAKIILRHYRMSDPESRSLPDTGTAEHHGGVAAELCRRMADNCESRGVPRDRLLFEGLNEPQLWSGEPPALTAAWYGSFLYWLHQFGLHGVVGNFGVGWPGNGGVQDAPVQWEFFKPVIAAMRPGDYLGLHEYWALAGPAENWRWWAGRYTQCPYDVPIVITECGIDLGVAGQPYGGWQNLPGNGEDAKATNYIAHLREYEQRLRGDSRIAGACIFTFDYGSNHWELMNIRNAAFLRQFLPYIESLPAVPEPEVTPVTPTVRYPLPVGIGHLTQGFGENPASYARFGLKGHNGMDWGVSQGTAVLAVDTGTVREVATDAGGYGNYVKLLHAWGQSLYGHLSVQGVQVGQTVTAGQQIGLSGNTGNSTGPHLHLGIRVNPDNHRDDGWAGYTDPARYLTMPQPVNVDEVIRTAAWAALDTPHNPAAALEKCARSHDLGAPLTAEFDANGYRVQCYALGVVACRIGDWSNVQVVDW